ncbi:hypothetical protein M0811_00845 [Anaeramoeba ignava]|uniref:Shq1 C-terminal domain-containing protein n=1 Tax=Anaeramoeba ignava TaxID=1746090 RepID=A0A9Q0RBI3_ANAIG|nr:hypothetical protein M0811_00845 [Anaeramoeba ignava]
MADYALSFEFSHVFEFRPFWIRIQNKQKKSKNKNSQFKIRFSTNEKKIMTNLPNKEYLISNPKEILYSLIEIIFAFSYDNRTNLGEPTVESAWNITKLSGTLSWFDTYSSIKESFISCIRRSLVYPLYRNWNLSMKILEDTKIIFSQGKTQVLKCLLKIKDIFDHHELKWHLSKIYIDDFCVWFQKSSSNQLFQNISQELQKIQIKKSEINWNLEEIEKEVEKQKEENEIENEIGDVD